MSLVIASQFEEPFNERLRALDIGAEVVSVPEDRPLEVASSADIRVSCQCGTISPGR